MMQDSGSVGIGITVRIGIIAARSRNGHNFARDGMRSKFEATGQKRPIHVVLERGIRNRGGELLLLGLLKTTLSAIRDLKRAVARPDCCVLPDGSLPMQTPKPARGTAASARIR